MKSAQKIKQIEVDVTSFGEHGLSIFGNFAPLQIRPNFPFKPWTIVHGGQKIELAQK